MNQALLDKIESGQFRKDAMDFAVGDTVRVHTKVVEGDKERIQIFSGVVISRRGHGLNECSPSAASVTAKASNASSRSIRPVWTRSKSSAEARSGAPS